MKKSFCFFLFLLALTLLSANDASFRAVGNQLIPINESDIRVQKEILTINRVGRHLEVTVYYEFFNPVDAKDLLVGFEAPAPYNGNYLFNFPQQPYIQDFVVMMNGDILSYDIAHVPYLTTADGIPFYFSDNKKNKGTDFSHPYFQNGKIQSLTSQQCKDTLRNYPGLECPFHYVYHFKAYFNKGLNVIQHTYNYELSMYVGDYYWFDYILTAANRWANHQIDDFTLNINLGDCESFAIAPTFFKDNDDWTINGIGSKSYTVLDSYDEQQRSFFHIQKGSISFHRENFHPDGELFIRRPQLITWFWKNNEEVGQWMKAFQWEYEKLNPHYFTGYFSYGGGDTTSISTNEKYILQHFPLAYHGYVFDDKRLQEYFSGASWYVPNPAYKPEKEPLTDEEKAWMKFWEQ